jgi:hypothetical protein
MANLIVPPAIPTLTVGGQVFTDLNNLIMLSAYVSGTTNTNSSFRKSGASAGYQVPAGKTFKVRAILVELIYSATAANYSIAFLTATADVGFNTSSSFAGGTFFTNTALGAGFAPIGNVNGYRQEYAVDYSVAQNLYFAAQAQTSAITAALIKAYGYEV